MFGLFKKSPPKADPVIEYSKGELWWGLNVTNFEAIADNIYCPVCQKKFEPGVVNTVLYLKTGPGFFNGTVPHFDCALEKIKEAGEMATKRRLEIEARKEAKQ